MKKLSDSEQSIIKIRGKKNLSIFDLCSINDLSEKDLDLIFQLAQKFKKIGNKKYTLLKNFTIFNAFFENSTRTHSSFELAGKKLGADVINISGDSSVKKRETLLDTAQVINALRPEVIVVRTSHGGVPFLLSKHVKAAVINAGDGRHEHPSQALLDIFTIKEHFQESLKNKKMLIVGDVLHSRVFGSLVRLALKLKIKITVAAPQTLIPKKLTEKFAVSVSYDVNQAIKNTDIVYALRTQEERGAGGFIPTLREMSKTFGVSEKRFALAAKNAILMHPGPIMRDIEVHNALVGRKESLYFTQIENGLAIRSALLYLLGNRMDQKNKNYITV